MDIGSVKLRLLVLQYGLATYWTTLTYVHGFVLTDYFGPLGPIPTLTVFTAHKDTFFPWVGDNCSLLSSD